MRVDACGCTVCDEHEREKGLEQGLVQANRERLDWKRWLQDSEQRVKELEQQLEEARAALEEYSL